MASGFSDGTDLYIDSGKSKRTRIQYQPNRGGIVVDQTSLILKRPLTESERKLQQNLLLRSVEERSVQNSSISPMGFCSIATYVSTTPNSAFSSLPNTTKSSDFSISYRPQKPEIYELHNRENMKDRLQELEKHLLDDNDEEISAVSESAWSETMQDLINPSTTSSSSSTSSSITSKKLLQDSVFAISEGKNETAIAILTKLNQIPNDILTKSLAFALISRVNPSNCLPVSETYSAKHLLSTHLLHETSPYFSLGIMAVNLAIIDSTQNRSKIHIVDFDIGQGNQYISLIQALSERNSIKPTVQITALNDPTRRNSIDSLRVADRLTKIAARFGVAFRFNTVMKKFCELNRETIRCELDEALIVNFAFFLYKMPDESVSTQNPRDQLLRRVKSLDPTVVTLVEQELNTNTAPFISRFHEALSYYRSLSESLDSSVSRNSPDRIRVEECLARKAVNAVVCDGEERVERCEVFGKWRARMGMAGFKPIPFGSNSADSLRKMSRSHSHPGFTIKEEAGGIRFGQSDRIFTVASAWR